jgi:hypothetical protein
MRPGCIPFGPLMVKVHHLFMVEVKDEDHPVHIQHVTLAFPSTVNSMWTNSSSICMMQHGAHFFTTKIYVIEKWRKVWCNFASSIRSNNILFMEVLRSLAGLQWAPGFQQPMQLVIVLSFLNTHAHFHWSDNPSWGGNCWSWSHSWVWGWYHQNLCSPVRLSLASNCQFRYWTPTSISNGGWLSIRVSFLTGMNQ